MKTILSLIGIFFTIILLGAILSFCVISLFIYTTHFVVGSTIELLSWNQIASLLLVCGATSAVCTTPFLIAHSIRYPYNGIARIVTYTILTALAWIIIIPVCLTAAQNFGSVDVLKTNEPVLTPNFFRPSDGTLYYYTSVNPQTKMANGVSFELHNINSSEDTAQLLENTPQFKADIQPFADVLIYDTLQISKFVDVILPSLILTKERAQDAFSKGILPWLSFATWGLALYSLIGIRRLFRWRLLNFCTAILGFIGISLLNVFYSWGWDGNLFNFVTLPNWTLNCIITAVLSCLGILLAVFRQDPNMESVE